MAAWAARASSRAASRASARAWVSACGFGGSGVGGDGGGLGAPPRGLGLGDLCPDLGRVQACGLLAGGPGEHGGLADHGVEGGQRVGSCPRGAAGGAGMRASLW